MNYFFFVAEEVRELMAQLGFRTMDEMIGRADLLRVVAPSDNAKANTLDLSALLHLADAGDVHAPGSGRAPIRQS